ncbi:MAG: twin-arginine translocase TatA/TatE family subunit [Rickettsiales bacterium]
MGLSFGHLLLVLILVFVLFGAGRLPKVMGDLGRGIRNLREGLNGEGDSKQEVLPPDDKK